MTNQEWFEKKLAIGTAAEKMFEKYLTKEGWHCRKTKAKDPNEPYDYQINHKTTGHWRTIEIKNYGKPKLGTIFAETLQTLSKTTPEYLLYPNKIDRMIYVDQVGRLAYVYEMKMFAQYVQANIHKAFPIEGGTAFGIKIDECEVEAGYKYTISL